MVAGMAGIPDIGGISTGGGAFTPDLSASSSAENGDFKGGSNVFNFGSGSGGGAVSWKLAAIAGVTIIASLALLKK